MLEKKYKIESRLKICPGCQSFDCDTGEIFVPKKFDEEHLECTNPECLEVFCIIPMFEFSSCCPTCGFECCVEGDCYQIRDDESWNIFPYERLYFEDEEKKKTSDSDSIISLDKAFSIVKKELPPMPEGLEVFKVLEGKEIYPRYEEEYLGMEGDRNWTEVHYCPHCKEEYSFWNGS